MAWRSTWRGLTNNPRAEDLLHWAWNVPGHLRSWSGVEGRARLSVTKYCRPSGLFCWCLIAVMSVFPETPMDWSSSVSSVHGISQARILEWVVISFSRGSSRPMDGTCIFCLAGEFFTMSYLGQHLFPIILEAGKCPDQITSKFGIWGQDGLSMSFL